MPLRLKKKPTKEKTKEKIREPEPEPTPASENPLDVIQNADIFKMNASSINRFITYIDEYLSGCPGSEIFDGKSSYEYDDDNRKLVELAGRKITEMETKLKAELPSSEIYYHTGVLSSQMGRYDDGENFLQKALKKAPTNQNIRISLGYTKFKKSKYSDAINTFKNVLKNDSDNPHAVIGVALASEMNNNLADALEYYTKALKYPQSFPDLWLKRGKLLIKLQQYEEAVVFYRKALDADSKNDNFVAGLGTALYHLGKYDAAFDALKRALEINSQNVDALFTIARIYYEKNDFNNVLKYIDNILQIDPKFVLANILKIRVFKKLNRQVEANSILDTLVKSSYEDSEIQLAIAQLLKEQLRIEESQKLVEEVLKRDAANPKALEMKGEFLADANLLKDAHQIFINLIKQYPRVTVYKFKLGEILFKLGDLSSSLKIFEELDSASAQLFETLIHLKLKNPDKANNIIKKIADDKLRTSRSLNLMTDIITEPLATPEIIHKILPVIEELVPAEHNRVQIQLNVANALFTHEMYDEALAFVEDVTDTENAPYEAFRLKGLLEIELELYDDAEKTYEYLSRKNPSDVNILKEYANILLVNNHLETAKSVMKKIVTLDNNQRAIHKKLGEIYYKENDFKSALEYVTRALELNKNDEKLLELQIELLEKLQLFDAAQKAYQQLYELNPTNIVALEKRSDILIKNHQYNDALTVLQTLYSKNKDDLSVIEKLANVHFELKNYNESLQYYILLIDNNRFSHLILDRVLFILQSLNMKEKIPKLFDNLISKYKNDPKLYEKYADYLITEGQLDTASAIIDKGLNVAPDSPEFRLLMAKLYLTKTPREIQNAIKLLRESLSLNVKYYNALVLISDLLIESSIPDEADIYVNKALKLRPEDDYLKYLRSKILIMQKKYEPAIKILKELLTRNENNKAYLVDLAASYLAINSLDLAESIYKKILTLYVDNKDAYLGLAKIYIAKNMLIKAIEILTITKKYYPGDKEFANLETKVLTLQKDKEPLISHYEKQIVQNPQIRENYTILFTIYKDLGELDKALNIVDRALESFKDDIEFLLLKTTLLFEKKDLTSCLKILRNVLGKSPNNVDGLLLTAKILKEQSKLNGSLQIINRLIDIYPNNRDAYLLKAQIYIAQKNYDEVEKLLPYFGEQLEELTDVVEKIADEKFKMGRFAEALDLYNKILNIAPRWELKKLKIELLEKLNKIDDLLAYLDELIAGEPVPEMPVLIKKCQLLLLYGYPMQALETATKLMKHYPKNRDAQFTYIETLINLHKLDEAGMMLNRFKDKKDAMEIQRLQILIYIEKMDLNTADTLLKNFYEAYPERRNIFTKLKIRFMMTAKNYSECEKTINEYLKDYPYDYEELKHLAYVLYETNRNEESLNVIDKLLTIRKDDVNVLYLQAEIYRKKELFEEAENIYRKILRLDETFISSITGYVELMVTQKRLDDALKFVNRILQRLPENIDLLREKWRILKLLNRKFEEIRILEKIILKDQYSKIERMRLAEIYLDLREPANALRLINEILERDKASTEARIFKVQILCKLNRFDEAEEIIRTLIEEGIHDERVFNLFENIMTAKHDINGLIRHYEQLILKMPDENLINNYITCLKKTVSPAEILRKIDALIVNYPDNVLLLKNKAEILKEQSLFEEYAETLVRVHLLEPQNKDYLLSAAVAKYNVREFSIAKKLFETLLTIDKMESLAYVYLSRISVKEHEYEKAVEYIDSGLETMPDNKELLLELAKLMINIGTYEDAHTVLEYLLDIVPDDVEGNLRMLELNVLMKNYDIAREGLSILKNYPAIKKDVDYIEGYLDVLERKDEIPLHKFYDNNIDGLMMRGVVNYLNGNIEESKTQFFKVLQKNSFCIEALNNLGICSTILKNYDEARAFFNEALSLIPNYTICRINSALLLGIQQHYDESKKIFTEIIEIEPNLRDALYGYAQILLREGCIQEGLSILDKLIELNNEDYPACSLAVLSCLKIKLLDKAEQYIANLEKIKRFEQKYLELSMLLIDSKLAGETNSAQRKQYLQKLEMLINKLKKLKKDPELDIALGKLNIYAQKYDKSVTCFNIALTQMDDKFEPLFYKSYALYLSGKYNEALRTIDAALLTRNQSPDAWILRGLALDRLNRFDDALFSFETSYNMEPNSLALFNKGILFIKLERYLDAINEFYKILKVYPEVYPLFLETINMLESVQNISFIDKIKNFPEIISYFKVDNELIDCSISTEFRFSEKLVLDIRIVNNSLVPVAIETIATKLENLPEFTTPIPELGSAEKYNTTISVSPHHEKSAYLTLDGYQPGKDYILKNTITIRNGFVFSELTIQNIRGFSLLEFVIYPPACKEFVPFTEKIVVDKIDAKSEKKYYLIYVPKKRYTDLKELLKTPHSIKYKLPEIGAIVKSPGIPEPEFILDIRLHYDRYEEESRKESLKDKHIESKTVQKLTKEELLVETIKIESAIAEDIELTKIKKK